VTIPKKLRYLLDFRLACSRAGFGEFELPDVVLTEDDVRDIEQYAHVGLVPRGGELVRILGFDCEINNGSA